MKLHGVTFAKLATTSFLTLITSPISRDAAILHILGREGGEEKKSILISANH